MEVNISEVNITIDGQSVAVEEGFFLLEAARKAGIYIPSLCSHPDLAPAGACGICAVEIEGKEELVQACETKVIPGMNIFTKTKRVLDYRKDKLGEILAFHPHACLTCAQREGCSRTQCSSNVNENERCCVRLGNCELQKVTDYVGIKRDIPRYMPGNLPVFEDHPLFTRDYNLCIGCQRCVRICRDVRGVEALKIVEMDNGRKIASSIEPALEDSGCRFCTACVEVCPTGALRDKETKKGRKEDILLPCRSGCPANVDIPRYVRLIAQEKFAEANAVIRETVPLPASLGRVCFHPCEDNCRRGQIDQEISICLLKRFVSDEDLGWWREQLKPIDLSGKKVAVVGSGPAGLTAAYFLSRKGHAVTVLEALEEPGGMLRTGIPAYRLPKDVLAKEVQEIKDCGVKIETGVKVADSSALLRQGYDAVLVATGNPLAASLMVPGEGLEGVIPGLDFLRRVNLGEEVSLGEKVAVIGGGNVAVDTARVALRLGARNVEMYCLENEQEMPAWPEEVEMARKEGVTVHFRKGVASISGDKKASGFLSIEVASVFDEYGKFNPKYLPGTEEPVQADNILVSIGQRSETSVLPGAKRHGIMARLWRPVQPGECCPSGESLSMKFFETGLGLDEFMAMDEAARCLQCDLRFAISPAELPPAEDLLDFNAENIASVPDVEGVYQLFDDHKEVMAIAGTSDLRQSLEEKLEDGSSAQFFIYEEEPMYTKRESELLQMYLQEHGKLPSGGDDDDLF
ncbi:MAG: Putative NADH:acceptor oxidoreductase [Desulfotomaculum sp. 46_296]|nr:MAG: Putative NADH:acceptor oxidoreductase [Desulfotomaculum sp. 46_296]